MDEHVRVHAQRSDKMFEGYSGVQTETDIIRVSRKFSLTISHTSASDCGYQRTTSKSIHNSFPFRFSGELLVSSKIKTSKLLAGLQA